MNGTRQRWRKERLDQLNLVLWALWGPIGAGAPLDEYESYAPAIAKLLERGTEAEMIAAELGSIRVQTIGVEPNPENDLETARKLVDWFASVRREDV